MKWVDSLPLAGRKVLCRVDLNMPLDDQLVVTDDTRLKRVLPTMKYILDQGGKLICATHLGRPKGKVVEEMRMEPVGEKLTELLGSDYRIIVTEDVVGERVSQVVDQMGERDIVLLQNLRFHPGETANDEVFARQLAALADVYVNDAFGVLHRKHASVHAIVPMFKEKAGGFLLRDEIEALEHLRGEVDRPYAALLGGVKVSSKVGVLKEFLQIVDVLCIGGAMSNTFIKAKGGDIGATAVDEDNVQIARELLHYAADTLVEIVLPEDVVAAKALSSTECRVVPAHRVPHDLMALDIGPRTLQTFGEKLRPAKTVFWNGPMGVFERELFSYGTLETARILVGSGAASFVGGGDSAAAVRKSGVADQITHISTGGGASLEYIQGKLLPGIAALEE